MARLAFPAMLPGSVGDGEERLGRPAKSLRERVVERKFKAREHGGLLAGPLVGPEGLRQVQERYRLAGSDVVRRAVALEYEKALQGPDLGCARYRAHPDREEYSSHRGDTAVTGGEGDISLTDAGLPVGEFFERCLVHVKGPAAGKPFRLERWQQEFLDDFERRDGEGRRVFKRAVLGVARGNGKSPLAAGVALRELLLRDDAPDIYLAAAARDQARIVFEYASGFVQAGSLADVLQVGRHEIRNPANGGVLRTISADGYVAHGLNPSAVIVDELHSWQTDKQRELFDAIDTSLKRPDSFWLTITTASANRGGLLGKLHGEMLKLELERPHRGLVVARDEWNGATMRWYGADDQDDFDDEGLWEDVNPASWVTVRDLRRQRHSPSMSRSTFARLHLNAFVATDAERWLAMPRWEELSDPLAEIGDGATVYVGADGSRSYDTTCVAWAHRADDGRIDVDGRIFSVRPDVAHHVLHDGTIDFADVEAFLLELASRFAVREVRFDPRFLERSMDTLVGRLASAAVAPVEPYSAAHRQALQVFERAVIDGTVRHRADPAITEQVAWTACDRFDNGDPRRLRKLDRTRPIDASVALALAVQGALADTGGSVYQSRGMLLV